MNIQNALIKHLYKYETFAQIIIILMLLISWIYKVVN